MALDDATTALLQQLRALGAPPLHTMAPAEARAFAAKLSANAAPGPAMHQVFDAVTDPTVDPIDGPVDGPVAAPIDDAAPGVTLRVLVPTPRPDGIIVWWHGGGWVLGSADGADGLGRRMAAATGCAVVLVDYRLAPEHPFPAAVHDSMAALRWVDAHRADIAGRAVPLIAAGDSAGANLAIAAVRYAVAAGGPELALQALVYPITDCDTDTPSYVDPSNQLLLSRDAMLAFWDHYLPDPAARVDPDASPLRAEPTGHPPALVITAEHDPLRDEGEAYVARLTAAGVPVRHVRMAGQMHGFFTLLDALPGAAVGLDLLATTVRDRLRELTPR